MVALLMMLLCMVVPTEASGAQYVLGVGSLQQEGVPQGTVVKHTWDASRIYPGTTRDYWVYVPAQYTDAEPACVMVFQDGEGYVDPEGLVRAPTVFDNLIHKGEIPVTIGIFIDPGTKESPYDNREVEYVPLDDTYARFLLEEILPEVGKDYNLVDDAAGRAICGMSDGGLSAFTVAWERSDAFSKVISHVGSYTRLRGGSEYPYLIRKTRGYPKPIRVFLQDGANDINITEGNWTLANMNMASALMFARYDYRFEMGTGGHDTIHGGAIFPDTLRWIWRDYPGVKGAGEAAALDAVIGQWDVVTNVVGKVYHSVLTVADQGGTLTATLVDDADGEIEVTAISFSDGMLSYDFVAPPSLSWLLGSKAKESKDTDSKGTESKGTLYTWLRVGGDTFEGVLSSETYTEGIDFSVKGQRKSSTPDAD
jgi:enterochelin esterase family protein